MDMMISDWKDQDIWNGMKQEVIDERQGLARFLVFLAEVERRDLHLQNGYSCLKDLCLRGLGFCAETAKKRIWASHAAMKFPLILEYLAEGRLHFTGVCLLIRHLTSENHRELLEKAAELKTEAQISWWLAGLFPKETPQDWERLIPLDGDKAELRLIIDKELVSLLERSREIHKHKIPNGSALRIIKRALREDLKRQDPLQRRERRQKKEVIEVTSTSNSRRVPCGTADNAGIASNDHCNFVSEGGVQCTERAGLENDHCFNWAWGGSSKDPQCIQKLCFGHNRWKGRRDFKKDFRKNRPRSQPSN
jgi:hypothetical protein